MPGQATAADTECDVRDSRFVASLVCVPVQQNMPRIVESTMHDAWWSQMASRGFIDEGIARHIHDRWRNLGIAHPQNSKPSGVKKCMFEQFGYP